MAPNGVHMYFGDTREDAYLSDEEVTTKFQRMRANGIFFIMHRASEGQHFIDPRFQRRKKLAQLAGIKYFGGYHVLDSTPLANQFVNLKSAIGNDIGTCIAVAYDFMLSKLQPTIKQVRDFCRLVDATWEINCKLIATSSIREVLKKPIGFQNPEMINVEQYFARKDLWLYEYGPSVNVPWPWNDPGLGYLITLENKATGVWAWRCADKSQQDMIIFDGDENEFERRWS